MASVATGAMEAPSVAASGKVAFTLPHSYAGAGDEESFLWGPAAAPEALSRCMADMSFYPLEPAVKAERLGRVCDFSFSSMQRGNWNRDGRGGAGNVPGAGGAAPAAAPHLAGTTSAAGVEAEDEFRLVDSRPVRPTGPQNRWNIRQNQRQQALRQQALRQQMQSNQGAGGRSGAGEGRAQNAKGQGPLTHQQRQLQLQQQRQQQRQQQAHKNSRLRQLAEWSVEPQQEWTCVDIRSLETLPALSLDSSQIKYEDFAWRGVLRPYNRLVDKILPKHNQLLSEEFSEKFSFYWPGTEDDKLLMSKLEEEGAEITAAATDQVLACLMAAYHSKLSWHLVFQKQGKRLLMDKHNGSSVDLLTVDETHKDPPLADCPVRLNRPAELAAEALRINHNFSQQVLSRAGAPVRAYPAAPFVEAADVPAAKLYRYRVITLPPISTNPNAHEVDRMPFRIATRTEIDAVAPESLTAEAKDDPAPGVLILAKALNEYSPMRSVRPWKDQVETQKGALLALETKNNHNKVGRWICQAMLAGVDLLKLGFVTRMHADSNERHRLLHVVTAKTDALSVQIGLRRDNAWAIARAFIALLLKQEDGRYVIVKDPVKAELKLFRLP